MSEEEKKAIELLKEEPDFSLRYYERENAIDIVLNLIEKQENKLKEIKRLCDTKPYTAYTLYGDILHDTDDILEIIER